VAANAASFGGDARKLAVGGDSAGANLSIAAAMQARDKGGPQINFMLLIYPVTDNYKTSSSKSLLENAEAPILTLRGIKHFSDWMARDDLDQMDPLLHPSLAKDLSRLPPAFIQTAQYDPLRDEAEEFGEKLRAAGVKHRRGFDSKLSKRT
jgi:acetyl esterase